MRKDLEETWAKAFDNPGEAQSIGDIVVCDSCSEDFTSSPASGGMIFVGSAYCPACTERMRINIKKYHEGHMIRAVCPEGMSFGDFVRAYRGPDAAIKVSFMPRPE